MPEIKVRFEKENSGMMHVIRYRLITRLLEARQSDLIRVCHVGLFKDFDKFLAKSKVIQRQLLFNFGKVQR